VKSSHSKAALTDEREKINTRTNVEICLFINPPSR
jgi:hypothetical protein